MSTDAFSREPVPLRITSGCFQGRFKVAFNFFFFAKTRVFNKFSMRGRGKGIWAFIPPFIEPISCSLYLPFEKLL